MFGDHVKLFQELRDEERFVDIVSTVSNLSSFFWRVLVGLDFFSFFDNVCAAGNQKSSKVLVVELIHFVLYGKRISSCQKKRKQLTIQ